VIPPAQLATINDIAKQANVGRRVAGRALDRIRELDMLEPSEEIPGAEHFHDWEIYNPPPRAHSQEGERLRKASRRARSQLVSRPA
jgi:hypothetical protein